MRLSPEGFSFSLYNPAEKEPAKITDMRVDTSMSLTANLKRIFQETDFLGYPYKRVNAMTVSRRFTTAPLELFDEKQAELLFYYNHPKKEYETVLYNTLPINNMAVIFGIDTGVWELVNKQYPDARFFAQVTPLAEHFSAQSRMRNNRKIYAFFHTDSVDIFCYDRGNPLIINSFQCENTSDRIYFLLYVWKQLELNQQRDELHLSGELHDRNALTDNLLKFIREIFIISPAENIDMQALLTCE